MLFLKNKNILITGASRGFGARLAKKLWDEGANLFLTATQSWDVDFVQKYDSQKYVIFPFDLSRENVGVLFFKFLFYFNNIYGLINNAAIQSPIGNMLDMEQYVILNQWEKSFDVNLYAPIKLMIQFGKIMIRQGHGKIINMSGGGATSSRPGFSAYATAKTGLVRFSEIFSDEIIGKGVDVNCVAPGAMNTGMQKEILQSDGSPEKDIRVAKKTLEKTNTMDKPIELVKWLLSEKSDGVTGKLISAVWDDWTLLEDKTHAKKLYTLRRVDYA